MIRLGSRTPLSVRLHIRAQLAAASTTRAAQRFQTHYRQEATAIVTNSLSVLQRFPRRLARPWQLRSNPATPADPKRLLPEFKARYEDFIGLLCGAAQEMAEPGDAERYEQLRGWLLEHYQAMRPALTAHPDACIGADSADADPFAALFAPATLEQAIHCDQLLPHILETRRVVDAME